MKYFLQYPGQHIFAVLVFMASSQLALAQLPFSENFQSFDGSGFTSTPAVGQLDSDVWSITGLSDGDLAFGGTETSGDFARGTDTDGGVTTGGIYAFDTGSSNVVLGVQPGGSDFTPGEFILKITNDTGSSVGSLDVSYDIWTNNDQARANNFNFSYSVNGGPFTDVPALDFASIEAADALGFQSVSRSTTLSSLSLAAGQDIELKWTGDDISGSGSRDEFGLDNVSVSVVGGGASIVINEVDADTPSTDMLEFVELYDGGVGNTALDGLVLVFFNGSSDTSYNAFDLDGQSTDANGYFVIGNAAVANVDLVFSDDSLQNGADGVALYTGNDTDFPNGTAATSTNLLDAVVYDTSDADDAGLLAALGQSTQFNEAENGDQVSHSSSRVPNGAGSFVAQTATPGASNSGGPDITPPTVNALNPADDSTNVAIAANLVITFDESVQKGTGNITIHLSSDDSVVQTIPVTDAAVTVSGANVTIDPADLSTSTGYYVNIAAGAIEDASANDFAGITDTTTWSFTTSSGAASSVLDSLVFNEVLPDPNSATNNFDTDGDGTAETADEFVEVYNTSGSSVDISNLQFWDPGSDNYFTVPNGTTLGANGFVVVVADIDGGALPTVAAGSHAFSVSGGLSLSNTADNLVLYDPATDQYIQAVYNGDTIDTPAGHATDYAGFSATATRLGSVLDFGNDTDGTSLALSPDGDTGNSLPHNTIGGGSTLATPGTSNIEAVPGVALPVTETFDVCPLTGWTIFSVDADTTNTWSCNDTFSNAEANGFGDSAAANDWLISPAINLDATSNELVSFRSQTNFTDGGLAYPQLTVQYSTDYAGSGDPSSATWMPITGFTLSPEDSDVWTDSGEVDISSIAGSAVYIAFQYQSSGTGVGTSSRWRLDSIEIKEAAPEPTNHATAFNAAANSDSQITTTWTDAAAGAQAPGSYLLLCNTSGTFADPVDGVVQTDDTNCADGSGVQNIAQGTQTASWAGLDASTQYFFKLFPYTNSGVSVDYKTDGTPPTADATTDAPVARDCDTSGAADTCIHEIQGSGTASPLDGNTVTIEGIVVGDFQDGAGTNGDLNGFFVQEEDADTDADPDTSEGIFVFDDASPAVDVAIGDKVQVTGTVDEFFNLTELTSVTAVVVVSSGNTLPTAATISLPAAASVANSDGELIPDLEIYEGMLVTFPDTLTVTELFNLDRFGEMRLSKGGRLQQFTQNNTPDVTGYAAHLDIIARRNIFLDDGQSIQNPTPIIYPDGSLETADAFRMGNTVTNLTGVMTFSRGSGSDGDEAYRVHPTTAPVFNAVNTRPAAPGSVGGTLKVAGFNVLNYFVTLDDGSTTEIGLEPRGANNATEFARQQQKLVNALQTLDADVIGLVELENNFLAGSPTNAIENLVDELNAVVGAGTYDWVDPGTQFVGDDAIAVGIIYKTASVGLAVGTTVEILTDANLAGLGLGALPATFDGPSTNRASLAATFEESSSGEIFTIAVNHLKSKGSAGTAGAADNDASDGAGFANQTRLNGATALNTWLNTDPTGSGDADFILLGDFNAYAEEDPVTFLEGQGYTDLAHQFLGVNALSFVFDGQVGTLDYAFANSALLPQVTGVTEWHINADEADAIDYNTDFGRDPAIFDGTVPFRTSDHDPVIVGLDLGGTPPTPRPEIRVTQNGDLVTDDDGSVNFGETKTGLPIEKIFLITNTGDASLNLGEPALPDGFSLVGDFPGSVAASGEAEFIVQLDAQVAGGYAGEISFDTNDSNEDPFNFALTGTVVSDDGVDDEVEDNGPNDGDGNGDGIPDSEQNNVASIPDAVNGDYLTLSSANCELRNVYVDTEENQTEQDLGYLYPQGLIGFELVDCSQAELTLYFHGLSSSLDLDYRKFGPTTPGDDNTIAWYDLPGAVFDTAQIGGVTVPTATFTLVDGQLGDDTSVDNTIIDIGGAAYNPGIVGFTADSVNADENGGTATLNVSRVGTFGELSVDYVTGDDTAINGQDYEATQGTLSWDDGEDGTKTFDINLIDNNVLDGNKVAVAELENLVSAGADLAIDRTELNILDDESAQPGILSLLGLDGLTPDSEDNGVLFFAIPEDAGTLTALVSRTQGGLGEVSVNYMDESNQGTDGATEGDDYQVNDNTLTWPEGNFDERTFEISIIDDDQVEENELFFVDLTNPAGGAVLGDITALAISIIDNDAPACDDEDTAGLSTTGETAACFSNRLDNRYARRLINFVRQRQNRHISIRVKPDREDLGESAELLLVASWQPFIFGPSFDFARSGNQWVPWDGSAGNLPSAEYIDALPAVLELVAWDGRLTGLIGNLTFIGGYRLGNGEIVHNANRPFIFIVLP